MKKLTLLLLMVAVLSSCKESPMLDKMSPDAIKKTMFMGNPGGGGGTDSVYKAETYAGVLGSSGLVNGSLTTARFNAPQGIAFDSNGNMFVTDRDNNCIRKITTTGTVSVFAGSSSGTPGFVNGTGTAARFANPIKLATDASNNIYVADRDNGAIRKITPAGVVTTYAGDGTTGFVDNCSRSTARFNWPIDVSVATDGTVYVADSRNHRIRKIPTTGNVTTLAGSTQGYADGTGTAAKFNQPTGITLGSSGNILVADRYNACVRRITIPSGVVSTYIGSPPVAGVADTGHIDGPSHIAKFREPYGIACTTSGTVYIADIVNHNIRRWAPGEYLSTLAGDSTAGARNGDFIKFNTPAALAIDATGNLFVADVQNHAIRKLVTTTRTLLKTNGWTETTLATGLKWYRFNRIDYYARYKQQIGAQHINVLELDPAYFKFTTKVLDKASATTTSSMINSVSGAVAGINGTFGNRGNSTVTDPDHQKHVAFLKLGGTIVYDSPGTSDASYWDNDVSYNSQYWWQHEGEFHWDFSTNTFGMSKCHIVKNNPSDNTVFDVYKQSPYTGYSNIMSGAPILTVNYNSVNYGLDNTYYTSGLYSGSSMYKMGETLHRTAIAVTSNNHILLITVDGNGSGTDTFGLSCQDLTQFLQSYFRAKYALNLDGGGSTTMYIPGYGDRGVVNYPDGLGTSSTPPFDRQRNSLTNAIAVVPN
ncbi:MAG: phosphodiester glycosidase family protein [Daejeonella sp.]